MGHPVPEVAEAIAEMETAERDANLALTEKEVAAAAYRLLAAKMKVDTVIKNINEPAELKRRKRFYEFNRQRQHQCS